MPTLRRGKVRDRLYLPSEILGVSADAVGVATAIALVGPGLVGIVGGQLAPALIAALAIALLIIVYLASRLRSARKALDQLSIQNRVTEIQHQYAQAVVTIGDVKLLGMRHLGEMDRLLASDLYGRLGKVRDVLQAANGDSPLLDAQSRSDEGQSPERHDSSQWQPDPADPASFCIEPHEFEALLADATVRARGELGDDSRVCLRHVLFRLDAPYGRPFMPMVTFAATSQIAQKRTTIDYAGSLDRVTVVTLPYGSPPKSAPPRPWVADPTYLQLLRDSWRRMDKGFYGVGALLVPDPPLPGTFAVWLVAYVPTAGPTAGQGYLYMMSPTGLRDLMQPLSGMAFR